MKSRSGEEKYAVSNKGKQKDQRRRAHYTTITPGSPENSVTSVRTEFFSCKVHTSHTVLCVAVDSCAKSVWLNFFSRISTDECFFSDTLNSPAIRPVKYVVFFNAKC